MLTINNEKKHCKRRHTGVGVLLITNYFNEPYILLGQENWKSLDYTSIAPGIKIPVYEEFGGGIQSRKAGLEKNATFELREETANLFNIKTPELLSDCPYFDIPFKRDRMYRLYLVYIENIADYLQYFYMNLDIIKANRQEEDKSDKYLEMENIKLIPLKAISNKNNKPENYLCFHSNENINNNTILLKQSLTENQSLTEFKNKNINHQHLGYKGILRIENDVYINSRLIEFFNSSYNGITGLNHTYNLYKKNVISNMFKNNNMKIKNIKRQYNHNNDKYAFLSGTWSLQIGI